MTISRLMTESSLMPQAAGETVGRKLGKCGSPRSRVRRTLGVLVPGCAVFAMACAASPQERPAQSVEVARASTALGLGTQSFGVLAGTTVTNTGATVVSGDLGVSPGSAITGFPPGLVTAGTIHAADAVALQAQSDVAAAYDALAAEACNQNLTGQDLGGLTLTAGTYCLSSSAQLTGALTLDAEGDPAAVFVFQIGSTLITASNASVQMINGGNFCNVHWQVGSSATLGTGTAFMGSILALTSVTLNNGVSLFGRAMARNGAVTMDGNTVSAASCAAKPDAGSDVADASALADAGIRDAGHAADAGNAVDAAVAEDLADGSVDAGRDAAIALDSGADAAADAAIDVDAHVAQDAGLGADASMTACPADCAELQTNHDHCGSCGNVCGAAESCINGVCCAP